MLDSRQQLFQLRSIGTELKRRDLRTKERQTKRKAKQQAEKTLPRRLGKLKLVLKFFNEAKGFSFQHHSLLI